MVSQGHYQLGSFNLSGARTQETLYTESACGDISGFRIRLFLLGEDL